MCQKSPEPRSFLDNVISKKILENLFFVFLNNFLLFVISMLCLLVKTIKYSLILFTEIPLIIYQKMVNFTVLRNVVLTLSKIIRHFENSKLIFTWHKMPSMWAKFHCHTISSLENTRVGHFCLPPPNKICYPRYPT